MNEFRLLADTLHLSAAVYLLISLLIKKTCLDVSGKTQVLYFFVFTTRYVDIFFNFVSIYNTVMKILFWITSVLTLIMIFWKFRSTYNRKLDTFRAEFLVVPCLLLALVIHTEFTWIEIMWTFSIYLESVAIVPQIFMLIKLGPPKKVVRNYMLALAAYRTLYIGNWIYRYCVERYFDPFSSMAGFVQATLFWSFMISIYADDLFGKRGEMVEVKIGTGVCQGSYSYTQTIMENLSEIFFNAGVNAVYALSEVQSQLTKRGVVVKNEILKKNGYKNFKMFVEDQPWLVLYNEGPCWYVRLRCPFEKRPARALVDANKRFDTSNGLAKCEQEKTNEDEMEVFVDPYNI